VITKTRGADPRAGETMAMRRKRLVAIIAIVLGIIAVGFVATLIAIAPAYLD
jgi:hypothetical protein